MKNIGASVDAVSAQEKEEAEEVERVGGRREEDKYEEEEEYIEHRNEMYFFLEEYPEYRISAVGRWLENSKGEVIEDVDIYFLHITSGQRCESVKDCFSGWSEQDEESNEKWETLCKRIEELDGLEQIICDEESFGL